MHVNWIWQLYGKNGEYVDTCDHGHSLSHQAHGVKSTSTRHIQCSTSMEIIEYKPHTKTAMTVAN